MSEKWLSVEGIADHLGISKDTVYVWIKKGMPATKIGKLWKFKASEVDAWAKAGNGREDIEYGFNKQKID